MAAIRGRLFCLGGTEGQIVAGRLRLPDFWRSPGRSYWRSLATTVAARVTNSADYAEHPGRNRQAQYPLPGIVRADGIDLP